MHLLLVADNLRGAGNRNVVLAVRVGVAEVDLMVFLDLCNLGSNPGE